MLRSATVATLVVAGFLLGGIGYAWENGGGGDHGGGGVAIHWTNPASTATSKSYVTCSETFTPSVLTVKVQKLASGDSCTIHGTLVNTGNLVGTLSSSITIHPPAGCTGYTFTDNVPGHSIGAEGKFSVVATLTLLGSAGTACESVSATVSDTITATCSSTDGDHDHDGECNDDD